jgi:hypothetical protein
MILNSILWTVWLIKPTKAVHAVHVADMIFELTLCTPKVQVAVVIMTDSVKSFILKPSLGHGLRFGLGRCGGSTIALAIHV